MDFRPRWSVYLLNRSHTRPSLEEFALAAVCARSGQLTQPSELPLLLTVDEAAALLRTSRNGIYAMVERAQIKGIVRIGRRLLFQRDELMEWLGLNGKAKGKRS